MNQSSKRIFITLLLFTVTTGLVVTNRLIRESNAKKLQRVKAEAITTEPSPSPTLTPTLIPTSTPTPTPTPSPKRIPKKKPTPIISFPVASSSSKNVETIRYINQRRLAENPGVPVLILNAQLEAAAQRHSDDIGPRGDCKHDGNDGSTPWSRAGDAGYNGFASGEVVSCNMNTVQAAVDGWWDSSAHREVLMDIKNTEIGCAWWTNSEGFGWATCITGNR